MKKTSGTPMEEYNTNLKEEKQRDAPIIVSLLHLEHVTCAPRVDATWTALTLLSEVR